MSCKTIWENIQPVLERNLGASTYTLWIKNLLPVEYGENWIVFWNPESLFLQYVQNHIWPKIQPIFEQEYGIQIDFRCADPQNNLSAGSSTESVQSIPVSPIKSNSEAISIRGIPPNKTFDNFVVGSCNKFAHASALAVAENLGDTQYNPLYIYGDTGLGKTHLMYAIANYVAQLHPGITPLYLTTEVFTNDMILHLRQKQMTVFKQKYRDNCHLLLMDDIQFISNKEATQEELFHTFEYLKSQGHQIVFTSDVPPKDIQGLTDRLRTRFESGMLADMTPPDFETMLAIISQKSIEHNAYIPKDVCTLIARGVKGSVREVEGVLNRLVARSKVAKVPITIDFAKNHLLNVFEVQTRPQLDVHSILKSVTSTFNISMEDLIGRRRLKQVAHPRQIAMYLLKEYTNLSTTEIGKTLGGRDHTTILHGHDKIDKQLSSDVNLQSTIELIKRDLQIIG